MNLPVTLTLVIIEYVLDDKNVVQHFVQDVPTTHTLLPVVLRMC